MTKHKCNKYIQKYEKIRWKAKERTKVSDSSDIKRGLIVKFAIRDLGKHNPSQSLSQNL
jgi:hypothetical protein